MSKKNKKNKKSKKSKFLLFEIIADDEKRELRTKRINLVITPSLHDAAKRESEKLGISFNELVNQAIESFLNS